MEKNKKRWVLKPHGAVKDLEDKSGLSYRCIIDWVNKGGKGANKENDEKLRYLIERYGYKLVRYRNVRRKPKATQPTEPTTQPTESTEQ